MPITVYMHDEDAGGLIAIAEYGQQYDKRRPNPSLVSWFWPLRRSTDPSKGWFEEETVDMVRA
jgi:hypothetical protein